MPFCKPERSMAVRRSEATLLLLMAGILREIGEAVHKKEPSSLAKAPENGVVVPRPGISEGTSRPSELRTQ